MKEFIVRRGVFLKTINDAKKINNNLIITLIGFIIIKLFDTSIISILGLVYSVLFSLVCEYIIYIFLKKKHTFRDLIIDNGTLFTGFITYLLVSNNNYIIISLMIIFISLIKIILYSSKKVYLNPYLITLLVPIIFNNIYLFTSIYTLIYGIIILIYLLLKRYIKSYLVITFIVCLCILSIIYHDNMILSNIILILYVVPYSRSTPITKCGQIIYSIIISILIIITKNIIISNIIVSIFYSTIIYIERRKLR